MNINDKSQKTVFQTPDFDPFLSIRSVRFWAPLIQSRRQKDKDRFASLPSLRSEAHLSGLTKDRIRFAHLETLSKPLITNLKIQILKPRPLLTSLRSVRTVKSLDQLTRGLGFMPLIAYRLGFASPLGLSNPLTILKSRIQKTLDHCSPRFARFAWYLRISLDYE